MSPRYKSALDLPPQMRKQVKEQFGPAANDPHFRPRKYRNTPVRIDGRRFDSKLEGRCYTWLIARRAAGDVLWFVRQVRFELEGGVVYRADFVAILASGGAEVIDATGLLTPAKANKLKQVKASYGVDVRLWSDKMARRRG